MEDMKILWEDGVKMMDAFLKEFTLEAIIFITITDYLGLFSLSGQIKGKSGCVVCVDDTCYTCLCASKKMVYMMSAQKFGPRQGFPKDKKLSRKVKFSNQIS
jgi:hypothetical protein